jgi:hypothetical protein
LRVLSKDTKMKLIALTALMILVATSCDAPQRNRFIPSTGISSLDNDDDYTGDGNFTTGTNGNTNGNTNGGTTNNTNGSSEPGYENCDITPSYYGGSLGYFGICQKSSDERGFKFTFQDQYSCQGGSNMAVNCGTCFIPMHMQGNGSSFMVGPAECIHQNAGQTYYGTFSKNRGEAINATMVIHRYHLDSFIQCMTAKATYLSQCPGGAYNASCVQQADNYAYQVCSSFTQQHSGHYKQVSF